MVLLTEGYVKSLFFIYYYYYIIETYMIRISYTFCLVQKMPKGTTKKMFSRKKKEYEKLQFG